VVGGRQTRSKGLPTVTDPPVRTQSAGGRDPPRAGGWLIIQYSVIIVNGAHSVEGIMIAHRPESAARWGP
jgi:hypothetical protein